MNISLPQHLIVPCTRTRNSDPNKFVKIPTRINTHALHIHSIQESQEPGTYYRMKYYTLSKFMKYFFYTSPYFHHPLITLYMYIIRFCFCPLLHPSMCEAYCRWGGVRVGSGVHDSYTFLVTRLNWKKNQTFFVALFFKYKSFHE